MPPSKNPLARLHHIQGEIVELARAMDGASFEIFASTYVLRRSAEHALLIISEATKALPSSLTDRYPEVDWGAIRGIGNVLRHAYFEVDINVLWRIIDIRLPELQQVIQRMIDEQAQ